MSLGARIRSYGEGITLAPQYLGRVKYTSPAGKTVYGSDILTNGGKVGEEGRTWDYTHKPPYTTGGTFLSRVYRRPSLTMVGGGVFPGNNQVLGGVSSPFSAGTTPWSYQYEGGFSDPVTQGYDDDFFSSGFNTSIDTFTSLHPDDMSSDGSRAYNQMRPKAETFNLLQAAAELKDVPGMLRDASRDFSYSYRKILQRTVRNGTQRSLLERAHAMPKKISEEYLGTIFGWIPFISDVSNLFGLVDRVGVHIANRKKYNNKWIKRRRSELESASSQLLYSSPNLGVMACKPSLGSSGSNYYIVPNSAKYTISLEKSTSKWYVGKFKAYRPEFDDSYERQHPNLAKPRQVLTSLGYYANPIVIYKLTPWSWLSDWFVNIGDNLQAAQDLADNSVVSKEVFAMRHITSELKYRHFATLVKGGSVSIEFTRGFETKYRSAGLSPFGFSLFPGGFSSEQYAILGALGMSKFF